MKTEPLNLSDYSGSFAAGNALTSWNTAATSSPVVQWQNVTSNATYSSAANVLRAR